MLKHEKKAKKAPILLTETETDHVAGGNNGNHYGQEAREMGVPAWTLNGGNASNAPGHT